MKSTTTAFAASAVVGLTIMGCGGTSSHEDTESNDQAQSARDVLLGRKAFSELILTRWHALDDVDPDHFNSAREVGGILEFDLSDANPNSVVDGRAAFNCSNEVGSYPYALSYVDFPQRPTQALPLTVRSCPTPRPRTEEGHLTFANVTKTSGVVLFENVRVGPLSSYNKLNPVGVYAVHVRVIDNDRIAVRLQRPGGALEAEKVMVKRPHGGVQPPNPCVAGPCQGSGDNPGGG